MRKSAKQFVPSRMTETTSVGDHFKKLTFCRGYTTTLREACHVCLRPWRFNMTNVTTSINTVADRCVDLPVELKAQKLCVIYLFFRQWTGTATMQRADYMIGKDGYLPPEEVTANYGQKRVIDPVHLRVFDTLKNEPRLFLPTTACPFAKVLYYPSTRLRKSSQDYAASPMSTTRRETISLAPWTISTANGLPAILNSQNRSEPLSPMLAA